MGKSAEKPESTKGKAPDVDALYKLPLAEFTASRNALAGRLKKSGRAEEAERIKALMKPSVPAWAVNQLFWKHRDRFDRLIAAGDRLRTAQASKLAGGAGDVRGAIDELRETLSDLTRTAADMLRESGSNMTPELMRRVTSTLEALASIGIVPGGPQPGRLHDEVEPPGFETLAALVPSSERAERGDEPTRVLTFRHEQPRAARGKAKGEDDEQRRAEERKAQLAAAKAIVEEAERSLREARSTAQQAQTELKKAAARAKETEEEMVEAEKRLEQSAKEAHAARQVARRLAVEAETAAQAVEDAERALEKAKAAVQET